MDMIGRSDGDIEVDENILNSLPSRIMDLNQFISDGIKEN